MNPYLTDSQLIDWKHPDVLALAARLSNQRHDESRSDETIARACFHWVRDEIRHSFDFECNPVTCRASDVLHHRTGYCYAKSHLLVALLRACGLPAGLCYQRLSLTGNGAPYCLHGLVAIRLEAHGWYRIDPRGNKPGVDAQFTPPVEQLAFRTDDPQECDFPEIWPEPLPQIVDVLTKYTTWTDVYDNLPDIEIVSKMNL